MTEHLLAGGVQRRLLAQALLGQVHHLLGDRMHGPGTLMVAGGHAVLFGQLAGVQAGLVVRLGRLDGVVQLVGGLLDAIDAVDQQLLEVVFRLLRKCTSFKYLRTLSAGRSDMSRKYVHPIRPRTC